MDSLLMLPLDDHYPKHAAFNFEPILEPLEDTTDEDDEFFTPLPTSYDADWKFSMASSQLSARSEGSTASSEYENGNSHGPHSMLTEPITNKLLPSSSHSVDPHSMLTEPITNKFETSNPPSPCSVSSASSSSESYVTSTASTGLSELLGLTTSEVRKLPPSPPQQRRYRPPQGPWEFSDLALKEEKDETVDTAARFTKEVIQIQDLGDGIERHRSHRSLKPFDEPEVGWTPPPCEPVTLFRDHSYLSLDRIDETPFLPSQNENDEQKYPSEVNETEFHIQGDLYSPSIFVTIPSEPEREPENVTKSRGIGEQVEGYLPNHLQTSPPMVVELPNNFIEFSPKFETESIRMKPCRSDVSSLKSCQEARDYYRTPGPSFVALHRSNAIEQPPQHKVEIDTPKPSSTPFVASLMSCTSPNLRDAVECPGVNGFSIDKGNVFACHKQSFGSDTDDIFAESIVAVKKQWTKIASEINEKIADSNKEKWNKGYSGLNVWNSGCSCTNRNVLDSTLDGGDQNGQQDRTKGVRIVKIKTSKVRFCEPPESTERKKNIPQGKRKDLVAAAALKNVRNQPQQNNRIKNLVKTTRDARESAHAAVTQISEFFQQSSKAIMETPKKALNKYNRYQDPPPMVHKQSYHVAARLEKMKKWQQETEYVRYTG